MHFNHIHTLDNFYSLIITLFYAGIGMDTCVIPLRHGGLSLVQTTDYIYPIVDDPYMMVCFHSVPLFVLLFSAIPHALGPENIIYSEF
jgi:hypothetical protein